VEDLRDRERPGEANESSRRDEFFNLRARARSFRYARQGIAVLLATQHNAWIHLVASIAIVVLAAGLGVSRLEWVLLIFAIAAVWVAEAMNTAIEALSDAVMPHPHPLVGRAKDVAAAGVLIAAVAAAIVGFLILGPPLLAWLLAQ